MKGLVVVIDLSDGHLHILLTRYKNFLWQVISGQVPSLQFATALLVHQVYGGSGYSKFITVDYLGALGIGSHVWPLTFNRITSTQEFILLLYRFNIHKVCP